MTTQYQVISDFPGYRAKEEPTKLSPGTLVSPSVNVVTNTAGRVQQVKGYSLDGDASQNPDNGIQGWHDFDTMLDIRRNIRVGFLSAGNDAKWQYRYNAANGTVTWQTLLSGLASAVWSFCSGYWDTTELMKLMLGVNGDGNIYEWNGAVSTVLATTVNTIQVANAVGYYQTRNMVVTINGNDYTYTGVTLATGTLTGVTTDPRGEAIGSIAQQKPVVNAISGMAPANFAAFKPTLIQKGVQNTIYYGSSSSNYVYVSKVDNFKDCTYTLPTRIVAEGFLHTLSAPPREFVPQLTGDLSASTMILSAGKDYIYREVRTLSSDLTKETIELEQIRIGRNQAMFGAHSFSATKNGIAYLSNDKVVNVLGQISTQFVPELTDLSLSIIDDMTGYDFTGGETFYNKNYIYRSVPKSGIIRSYNMTDDKRQYWESPIQYPIAGFYVTQDGELGGHGYGSSESYLLFTGTRFRANATDEGFPINAIAAFAPYPHMKHVQHMRGYFPNRSDTKRTTELYVEGYISKNTPLTAGLNYDIDGCQTSVSKIIDGNNAKITCPIDESGTLGDGPFGNNILGDGTFAPTRPPYFNVVLTFAPNSYRFEQPFFTSYGIDQSWEIIAFGTDSIPTSEGNNDITQ